MQLFSRRKNLDLQSFMMKLVNNNNEGLQTVLEGPREEGRVRLTIVALIIPVEGKRPKTEQAFAAVTREFSTRGVSIVLNEPRGLDEVILGFRVARELQFVRAKAKHLNPMGAGFYQIGMQMTEMLSPADYPELETLAI